MSANIFELLNDESSKKKPTQKVEAKSQPQKGAKKAETGAKKAAAPAKGKDAKPAQKGGAGVKANAPAAGQRKAGGAGRGGAVGGAGGAIDPSEKKSRTGTRREVSKDRNRDNHNKQAKDKTGAEGPRGKRTFERRSGTGRAANENKKGGSGRGNWGRNDGTEQLKSTTTEATEEAVPKTEETTEAPRQREEKEEEDKTMTLEDYRKTQVSVKVKLTKSKKARKVNEGEDKNKWADYTPLTKEDELTNAKKVVATKEKEPATQENKKTKKKTVKKVPLSDILDTRGSNKPRGGGGAGGGRGRGAGTFDKKPVRAAKKPSQTSNLVLDDDSSFPVLG